MPNSRDPEMLYISSCAVLRGEFDKFIHANRRWCDDALSVSAGCPGRCLELKVLGLLESNHCNIYHLDFISSTILRPFVTQRLWGYRKLLQIQRLRIPPFVSITDNHNRLYGSPDTSNYNVYHVSWPWRNKGLKQPHQRKKNLRNKNHHRSIVEKSERF